MSYLSEAFEQVCKDVVKAGTFYVVLWHTVPFYGGPEEGGWWGSDEYVMAYAEYPSAKIAEQVKEKVLEEAERMTKEADRSYGEQCLRECEEMWEKGEDPPNWEPDGPSKYWVEVTNEVPQNHYGQRYYS